MGVFFRPRSQYVAVLVEDGPENDDHHKDVQQRADGFFVFRGRFEVGGQVKEGHRQAGKQEGVVGGGTEHVFNPEDAAGVEADGSKYQGGHEDGQGNAGEWHVLRLGRLDLVCVGQNGAAAHEDAHAHQHTNACGGKGVAPAVLVAQPGRDKVARKGTDVDAHVENVVPFVFEAAVFRFVVQIAQQGGNVRFECAVAQDDEQKTYVEGRFTGNGEGQVTCGHEQATGNDGFSVAKNPIREQSADEGGQVNQGNVGAVDVVGAGLVPTQPALEAVGHVEEQDPDDEVEAEAFPHFGEKQGVQALGVRFCDVLAHVIGV